ncbi:MAG: hypothetical protein NTY36_01380 [Deltaproteobacteria bacterium]|nr:hypothetical protein [Deltaproteobacteria bacterium]
MANNIAIHQAAVKAPPPGGNDWRNQLLAKFPIFDPAWSPEVQGKWLDGLSRLCEVFESKSAGGGGRLTVQWRRFPPGRIGAKWDGRREISPRGRPPRIRKVECRP